MANKFETATNNYGNHFSNNNGNHHYTTYGHKYDDSSYVITYHYRVLSNVDVTTTKNGYPSNSVTSYGQGYTVSVTDRTYSYAYTQSTELRFPSNINTKGKIEGTLSFSVDKTSVPASGGTVNIYMPDLKYTATRDTRGYRYVDVTITPNVPANPDNLDDDGTDYANSTVEKTTYVGENRQGFLNYKEPTLDYTIYSSYGDKGGNPFWLRADTKIYNGPDSKTGGIEKAWQYDSVKDIVNTYMHMYDNLNIIFSYAYAPYHDEVKGNDICSKKEGVGWTHINTRLEVADNFLSTYPKKLTMSYKNTYWTISYDGVYDMPFTAAFEYNGTYGGVTSSTDIDNNLTSYDRSTTLYNWFGNKITYSSTTPSYVATSYTISQPKATLVPSYMWSLPETAGTSASNFDTKTGAKYVNITRGFENNYISYLGTTCFVDVAKQGHYMGYVSGNLDNSFVSGQSSRIIYMDQGTTKEGTIGNLKWTDCENRTERFFNARLIMKFDNCRNQNITSITNEYYNNDKRMPMVTLKCRQLPAHWNHPGIIFGIKCQRYVVPTDSFSRFDSANPFTYIYHGTGMNLAKGEVTAYVPWTISTHAHKEISTVSTANDKLRFVIQMPTITTPYIKSTVAGSISASASTTYVGPTKSDITITPTWNVPYTRGYDKGFEAAEWKYSFVDVKGYNDDPNSYNGDGMDYSGVTGFNDFIVHLNKCEDFNYRYPSVTLTATTSNSTFSLDTTTNTAESEHSLADGAKSAGFTVSVPANPKTGSNWGASIVTTPTTLQSGKIRLTSGDMKNSVSRSTTISFSNSFDTNLTSGSISNPSSITITQGPDKWGGAGIGICFEVVASNAGQALSGNGVCLIRSIPDAGSPQVYDDFSIGTLKERHQLVLIGIGTVAGSDKSALVGDTTVTVTSSGAPSSESSSDFTYTSTINAWCDDYSSIGTTYGPNGSSSKYVGKYTVSPYSVSWKRQYKFNGSWQDSATLSIGNHYGSTTAASCVVSGNAINNNPFYFTPSRYNGSRPRTLYYRVGAYDNNSGQRYENTTDYSISQDGSDPYYNNSSFTFSSSTTRCTVSGLQSSVSGTSPTGCGSFSVTPNTNPFTGNIAYTNGMVPGSHSNNITSGITSGSTTISKVGDSNTNLDYGTTNPNKSIGVGGDSTIQWSTTGALKYKFYYNYTVTCSSGAKIESGNIESSEQTWTPSANATNYTLKMRYMSPGSSNWTSWSTTLTTTANSIGTWKVQGGFFNGNTQYGSSTEYSFVFSTIGADYNEYRCTKINITSDTPYTTKDATYTVTPTLTYTIQKKTFKGDGTVISDWTNTNYTNGVTLNASNHTFTNMVEGQTYKYTFTASIASGISDSTSTDSNKSHKVSVYRDYNTITENRTYCTMSVTNAYISAWDTSGTTSCTFTATKQTGTSNDGGVTWTDWVDNGTDTSVTINASSKELIPTTMGSSSTTTSDTTFTFTLSGGTNMVGTTSIDGHVYKYGKSYYNS